MCEGANQSRDRDISVHNVKSPHRSTIFLLYFPPTVHRQSHLSSHSARCPAVHRSALILPMKDRSLPGTSIHKKEIYDDEKRESGHGRLKVSPVELPGGESHQEDDETEHDTGSRFVHGVPSGVGQVVVRPGTTLRLRYSIVPRRFLPLIR